MATLVSDNEEIQPPVRQAPVVMQPNHTLMAVRRTLYSVLDVLEILLLGRFIAKLFIANPASLFIRVLYSTTEPLVIPFRNFFPGALENGMVIELSSLVAMVAFAIGTYLLMTVFFIIGKHQR